MKPVLFRSFFLFGAAIVQFSLANTLFVAWPVSVPILLSVVVSFTLLKGFSFSWKWAIVGGIFFDAITLGRIGGASLELVLAAAIFSIVERQFFFEYRLKRILFFGGAVWFFDGVLRVVEVSFLTSFFGRENAFFFSSFFSDFHWGVFFWTLVVSVLTFWFLFRLTAMFERYIELFERIPFNRKRPSFLL